MKVKDFFGLTVGTLLGSSLIGSVNSSTLPGWAKNSTTTLVSVGLVGSAFKKLKW